jgi:chemotaxis protein CheD
MSALVPSAARDAIEVPAGEIRVPVREGLLTAVVSSSVAICLWDPRTRAGGLGHFVVPCRPAAEPASPRFGDVAATLLVDTLRTLGSCPPTLVAGLYGGASVLRGLQLPEDRLGSRNVAMARITLASAGIRVSAEEVGGAATRKIVFDLADGSVRVEIVS